MKLQKTLTPPQISELKRPNPPTEAAIKRAQFVDKTYVWRGK